MKLTGIVIDVDMGEAEIRIYDAGNQTIGEVKVSAGAPGIRKPGDKVTVTIEASA